MLNKQFRNAFLRVGILHLLSKNDMYGYDLVAKIGDFFEVTSGSVYPILYKLSDEELVETYLQESSEGGARKYYKLNKKGIKTFKEELKEWNGLIGKYQKFIQKK
jgi:PadR family transcriptional regulator PadR